MYVAAYFGHKQALAYQGIFYENGIITSPKVLEKYFENEFKFLTSITDIKIDLLDFKASMSISEFT